MNIVKDYLNMLSSLGIVSSDNACQADFDIPVKKVSYSSKDVEEGTLFICKGINFKQEYLFEALEKGATSFVASTDSKEISDETFRLVGERFGKVPRIIVNDIRLAITKISAMYFGRTWDQLDIIGITGTKGKTTTATFVYNMMKAHLGHDIGFSHSLYTFDGKQKITSVWITTPEPIELHSVLNNCVKNNAECVVMEVSSQALKYDRVEDVNFDVGVFTNISEDHLSDAEHKDMEDYFTSKLKLIKNSKNAIINLDMDERYLPRVINAANHCKRILTYGSKDDADIRLISCKETADSLEIAVSIEGDEKPFTINMGGSFNAENALAAIAVGHFFGVSYETMRKSLAGVKVDGRMEHVTAKPGVDFIVDYAHNLMSYQALFDYAKKNFSGRDIGIICGSPGDKAINRRAELGKVADENADYIVITRITPSVEDIGKVCAEVYEHIAHKEKARVIPDRDEAFDDIFKWSMENGNCITLLAGCSDDHDRLEAFLKTL